jgi:aconitate hydratase
MMRGTFANIRLKNEMVARGRFHPPLPDRPARADLDVAMRHKKEHTPQILIAAEYGTGTRATGRQGREPVGVKAVVCDPSASIARTWSAWRCLQFGRHDAQDTQPHRPRAST